jgi:hypothetical protein
VSKQDPRDNTEVFSIGMILVKMEAVTREDLRAVLEEQKRMSQDELLGELMVRRGMITEAQLAAALNAQRGLRSRRGHVRAMAAADLAGRASEGVRTLAGTLREAVSDLRRKRTGEAYPAITPALLASTEKKDA